MLRLQISKLFPKVFTISFAKQATNLLTQCHNIDIVTKSSPSFSNGWSSRNIYVSPCVNKYSRKSGTHDIATDSEDEKDPDFKDERDSKVIKTKVNSLRADLLLKAGLGIARNKIENIFYESKIRVNGQKLIKKSVQLYEGDEIDVIRGFSQKNPSHLVVSRVIILSASMREEGYAVTLRRYKSLLVENYLGTNVFKSSSVTGY